MWMWFGLACGDWKEGIHSEKIVTFSCHRNTRTPLSTFETPSKPGLFSGVGIHFRAPDGP